MPKVPTKQHDATPEKLRPFVFHGVHLDWSTGKQATCACPFCGKDDGKFSVNIETGLWQCWSCRTGNDKGGGNDKVFLRSLWDISDQKTTDYSDLAAQRKLLEPETLMHWGAVKSFITDEWLLPAYDTKGQVCQLYKYYKSPERYLLLPTPTMGQHLFGMNLFDKDKSKIYLCEGPWDGMAFWEVTKQAKVNGDSLATTASISNSLLGDANVLAVPGCRIFFESWLDLFAGKIVYLMYDSDHPKKHPHLDKMIPPSGLDGMMRVAKILSEAPKPPAEIHYLNWGPEGYDPGLPSGFDVRDRLAGTGDTVRGITARIASLGGLLRQLEPVPDEWQGTGSASVKKTKAPTIDQLAPVDCTEFKVLRRVWQKAMKWTAGLDHGLTVMLASIASTPCVGDQLWVKIIGPAACGKSTLCEAVSVNTKHILAKSTIRGFHSGFKSDGGERDEDNSLIALLYDKTLVTKDGDTLLQSPNLPQILSEGRDVYDGTSRTHYRNAMSNDYHGLRMTWILCGTSSLRAIDSSELGERFLDCVIMEGIDDELEDEIIERVGYQSDRNLSVISEGANAKSQYSPELVEAMQLTGGYVDYLRDHVKDILPTIRNPDWAIKKCARLGKFVAHMRARPSIRQEETAEREFATRLVSQLVRLSKCLAFALNKDEVDDDVMARVTKVAMDTSRGQTLTIAQYLLNNPVGLEPGTLAKFTVRTEEKTKAMLRFMKLIGIVDAYTPEPVKGIRGKPKWRLTPKMLKLFEEINA